MMTTHNLTRVEFFVPGVPAPQGSKRYLGPGRVVESSKRVAPWRADIRAAAQELIGSDQLGDLWDEPIEVELDFYLPRPKSHYGTGRNVNRLKNSAPSYPCGTPDLDKLTRAAMDAIAGVVIADDKTVVEIEAHKRYVAVDQRPGVNIVVKVAL